MRIPGGFRCRNSRSSRSCRVSAMRDLVRGLSRPLRLCSVAVTSHTSACMFLRTRCREACARRKAPRMRNTRGVSSFNDLNTDNTRILECIYCILLYFIHGTPVFSILGDGTTMEHVVEYNAIALEVFQRVTANTRPVKRKIA